MITNVIWFLVVMPIILFIESLIFFSYIIRLIFTAILLTKVYIDFKIVKPLKFAVVLVYVLVYSYVNW